MSKRLEMIEGVLAKGSRDPNHWYMRAMELRALGRLEEAREAYGAVRAEFPDYVPTYLMAVQVCAELGRADEAREWGEQGLDLARATGETKAQSEIQEALDALEGG